MSGFLDVLFALISEMVLEEDGVPRVGSEYSVDKIPDAGNKAKNKIDEDVADHLNPERYGQTTINLAASFVHHKC